MNILGLISQLIGIKTLWLTSQTLNILQNSHSVVSRSWLLWFGSSLLLLLLTTSLHLLMAVFFFNCHLSSIDLQDKTIFLSLIVCQLPTSFYSSPTTWIPSPTLCTFYICILLFEISFIFITGCLFVFFFFLIIFFLSFLFFN